MTKPQNHGRFTTFLTAALLLGQPHLTLADETTLSLAGTWGFQLDAKNTGVQEKWFASKLEDSVQLPGTTDENHEGIVQNEKPTDRLARPWFWKVAAWYQREVNIPDSWAAKRVTLFLERTNTRASGSMTRSAAVRTR